MYTVYYKNARGEQRFPFTELSETAKLKAMDAIKAVQKKAFDIELSKAKKGNINDRINNKLYYIRVYNASKHCAKLNNLKDLERNIIENQCEFLKDGTYITYSIDFNI